MSRILSAFVVILTLSLAACTDSSDTRTARVEHSDARLGSHVPHSNAAASQDEVNPAVAGERAFAGGAGSTGNGGGGNR